MLVCCVSVCVCARACALCMWVVKAEARKCLLYVCTCIHNMHVSI